MTDEQIEATGADTDGGIGRRSLIKKAAAAGAIVWTAPIISGSLASPAAAATLPSLCFKYQHNWASYNGGSLVTCLNSEKSPAQSWTGPCDESHPTLRLAGHAPSASTDDRYKSNSCSPNRNCCQPKDAGGNSIDWWDGNSDGSEAIATFPNPECVYSDPVCPGVNPGYSNNETITFHIDRTQCPGCYFADAAVAFTQSPGNCSALSSSCNNAGTSDFFNSVEFRFTGGDKKYPIYFKFWIACNLNWNTSTDQYVPNSQCDIPQGEPNANPGHTKGATIQFDV